MLLPLVGVRSFFDVGFFFLSPPMQCQGLVSSKVTAFLSFVFQLSVPSPLVCAKLN